MSIIQPNTYQDPTVETGTGACVVRYFDFDGKVLKIERVVSGATSTPPTVPYHQYLTFNSWNQTLTGITGDLDVGPLYDTTNGKTYVFVTMSAVTGLIFTLDFTKSSTSLMTIDWGDGSTSGTTTSSNQALSHTYTTAGDYIITVDNPAGGTYYFGGATLAHTIYGVYTGTISSCIRKVYFGLYNTALNSNVFYNCSRLESISLNVNTTATNSTSVFPTNGLKTLICPSGYYGLNVSNYTLSFISLSPTTTTLGTSAYGSAIGVTKVIIPSTVTTMGATCFGSLYNCLEYIVKPTTPPSLTANSLANISPLAKIYVPDASLAAYAGATNWVTYAAQIFAISTKP